MSEEHKSEELKLIALANGWKAQVVPELEEFEISGSVRDIIWKLYAKRDEETFVITWRGDVQTEARYNYGDYWVYPSWRAWVIRILEGKPNAKKFSAKDKGKFSSGTYEELIKTRNVPWENDDVRAFDILIPVLDKEIYWITSMFEAVKERREACPKDSNLGKAHFRVYTTSRGIRVLEWANSFGFQACYVKDILEVRG